MRTLLAIFFLQCLAFGSIQSKTCWDVQIYNGDFTGPSEQMKMAYLSNKGFNDYLKNLQNINAPVWDKVRKAISEYRPRVVGISSKSQNFASACMVASIAKHLDPSIIVVVGGPHPSAVGKEVMSCAAIDIAVMDLMGKHYGLRVCDLLGGAETERLPAYYATGIGTPDEIARLSMDKVDEGYRRIQIKAGGRDVAIDIAVTVVA